jgi:ABC-type dipeptide/oligopeptide/nickel transport system permease component
MPEPGMPLWDDGREPTVIPDVMCAGGDDPQMVLQLIIRRLFFLVFVLFALSVITFTLMHIVPSDPARNIAGPRASPAAVQQIREEYGLDRPIVERYMTYVKGVATLDLGRSLSSRRPVTEDLRRYLPATLELAFTSMTFALLVGVSLPSFWLAIVLQFVFFAQLQVLPDGQRLPVGVDPPRTITTFYTIDALLTANFDVLFTALKHLAMPAFVLGFISLAPVTRMIRSSMLEVLNQDYVRTARAKGLRNNVVITRHALKNAMLPAVTVLGLQLGLLLSGTVLVEIVFSWPGIGRYAFQAIQNQDPNALISVTLIIGLGYVLANLIVDVVYMFLDPRIRVA